MSSIKQSAKRVISRIPILRRVLPRQSSLPKRPPIAHGPAGIEAVGHRRYVGGLWDEIGQLQFDFLVKNGLKPHHYFLDVACGSLRAGVHLIPYLEPGHYLGIDKEPELIEKGVKEELSDELVREKQPEFVVSEAFEFEKFSAQPDYAIAQSLFTHLTPPIIHACMAKLRPVMPPDGVFYATFFETDQPRENLDDSHDHGLFYYTREEMQAFGEDNGWTAQYIGDWNHPRDQVMVEYRPA